MPVKETDLIGHQLLESSQLLHLRMFCGERKDNSQFCSLSLERPRDKVLESNGSEVQGLTLGEDMNFQLRALIAEMLGAVPEQRTPQRACQEGERCAGA